MLWTEYKVNRPVWEECRLAGLCAAELRRDRTTLRSATDVIVGSMIVTQFNQ